MHTLIDNKCKLMHSKYKLHVTCLILVFATIKSYEHEVYDSVFKAKEKTH